MSETILANVKSGIATSRSQPRIENHWFAIVAMALAVYPLFRLADLPLRVDVAGMGIAYWGGTTARALFLAILIAIVAFPAQQTVLPLLARYGQHKVRLIFLAILAAWLVYILGPSFGLMLWVDTIAIAELMDRAPALMGKRTLDAILPATYLFVGLLLVFSLNHAIAGMKYAGAWDGYFNRLDVSVFRCTVPEVAQWSRQHLPQMVWQIAALAYYNVYGQIGAVLVILALTAGRRTATTYVGTLLAAYAMALVFFYLMPTMGPFALRTIPLTSPDWLAGTFFTQKVLPMRAQLLWQHAAIPELYTVQIADYYIGFPSMHVAMPVIALWFTRRWKKLTAWLVGFDLFLILGIVLLEWHYLLDIVGGILVGIAAIALCARES
jgi:hypothetical protein